MATKKPLPPPTPRRMALARNKIRRLEHRQAELLQAVDMANGLARHAYERRDDAVKELVFVRAMLPTDSIALPPNERPIPGKVDDYDVVVEDIAPPLPEALGPTDFLDELRHFYTAPLHQVIAECDQDQLRLRTHCTLKFAGGEARYAVSDRTLSTMSREALVNLLAKNVIPAMIRMVVAQALEKRKHA